MAEKRDPGKNDWPKFFRRPFFATVALLLPSLLVAQHPSGPDPHPFPGVEFVLKSFDQYRVVGIGELPGCEEAHEVIRSLIRNPAFPSKVEDIVVDFGNPLMQPVVDRYLLEGELVPRGVLRRVWDDTTRSVDLTWDSPVYEQFFDTVRSVNAGLPRDKKIHVVVADAPIDWSGVKQKDDLAPFLELRAKTLADSVNAIIAKGRHGLVISFAAQQFRTGIPNNARVLIDRANPGKFFSIVVQGRFGGGEAYKAIEAGQDSWDLDTVATVRNTWLGSALVSSEPSAPTLEAAFDAVLFVGPSDSLTILRPSASVFQDEDYWTELNRRWIIVKGQPFNLAAAGFDLRSRFLDPLPFMPRMKVPRRAKAAPPRTPSPAVQNGSVMSAADFVIQKINQYPMIGLGDVHTCLEFHEFLHQLMRDPRLPGKVNDVVVEFGNPLFQTAIDRYVINGENVPREERKGAWENAVMGWSISASPVYEAFFDVIRDLNAKMPRQERMRVILGDAPLDFAQMRKDPATVLRKFATSRSAPISPSREAALAASVHAVLAKGHRGLIIAGSGHLRKGGLPGTARELIEKQDPGKLYYLEYVAKASSVPIGSVIVQGEDARLYMGAVESETSVRVSPLVFRDAAFWRDINVIHRFTGKEWIDLARPEFEYRGRYFEAAWPEFLRVLLAGSPN
jgi:hypothetical protein